MPASSGIFSLLDLLQRDPNAGGARGAPVVGPGTAPPMANAPAGQQQQQQPRQMYGSWDPDFQRTLSGPSYRMPDGSVNPELAKYFTPEGQPIIDDPRKVAAEGGVSVGDLASGFFPRYGRANEYAGQGYSFPSDKGGFFSLQDLYGLTARSEPTGAVGPFNVRTANGMVNSAGETETAMVGRRDIPQLGAFGAGGASTNNWRLLAPWGGGPGDIMRNGFLIHPNAGGTRWGGPAVWTPSGGNTGEQGMLARGTGLGAGAAMGVPNMLQAGLGQPITYGWPGQNYWFSGGSGGDTGLGG
jgi:hypothetical protein